MIRPIFIASFLIILMACASQRTHFVPFDRIDYEMAVSFHKFELRVDGESLITGRVTDRVSGNAIPGAIVFVAESKDADLSKPPSENPSLRSGTVSDREGYFEIRSDNIKLDDVLVFRFIGYLAGC